VSAVGRELGWYGGAREPVGMVGTTIGITTGAAPQPPDDAIMRIFTRLLGESVGYVSIYLVPLFQDVLSFCHHLRLMRRQSELERIKKRMLSG
jgi:hypothetical protein